MGTSAKVTFVAETENKRGGRIREVGDPETRQKALSASYLQCDGYPSGWGADLAEFLNGIEMVNGLGATPYAVGERANGAGCLAAQWIAKAKTKVGGVYMVPVDDPNGWETDYAYRVIVHHAGGIRVTCHCCGDLEFDGTVAQFVEFCEGR